MDIAKKKTLPSRQDRKINYKRSRYFFANIAVLTMLLAIQKIEAQDCGDVTAYGYQIIYLNGNKTLDDIATTDNAEGTDIKVSVDGSGPEWPNIYLEPSMTYEGVISLINSAFNRDGIAASVLLEANKLILRSHSEGPNSSFYLLDTYMLREFFQDFDHLGGAYRGGEENVECMLVAPQEFAESFELSFGQWSNSGAFNWIRRTGSTPSATTGPNGAAHDSYYAYMETSSGSAYNSGNTAILESAPFYLRGEELHFKYHMYGEDMGTLYLELYNAGQWYTLWSHSGKQQSAYGSHWEDVWVSLEGYTGNGKLRFRGVAAGGYRGDMAIDGISIRLTSDPATTEYIYDALGRLRLVKENEETKEGYKYDRAGNFCDVAPEDMGSDGYCE